MVVTECFKCGRPLLNGLCAGCNNAPKECTCEEEEEGLEESGEE